MKPAIDINAGTAKGIEIFAPGDYGDKKGVFTEDDLRQMAASYSKDKHEAPITLDHAEGGPALGWVSGLRYDEESKKLCADFTQVNPAFMQDWKRGAWKKRSVEIYRSFAGNDGKPYVRAVTFLGAASPHVKGMKDIEFAEGARAVNFAADSPFVSFDYCENHYGSYWPSYEPKSDPFPGAHGPIVEQIISSEILGHCHYVYLDAKGSGFTSPEMVKSPTSDCWVVNESGHSHQVTRYEMQSSDLPVAHQHGFTAVKSYSQPTNAKDTVTMSEPTKAPGTETTKVETPVKMADDQTAAQFAEIKAELKQQKEKNDALEAQLFNERETKRFDERVSTLLGRNDSGQVRLTPAQVSHARAIFNALPADKANVVKFSDPADKDKTVELGARDAFLKFLEELPVVVTKGAQIVDTQRYKSGDAATFEEQQAKLAKMAEEIEQRDKISYSEALKRADAELKSKRLTA